MTPPLMPVPEPVRHRLNGSPLVVMLDVDGTLSPIASRPQDALVPAETRRAVAALATRSGVQVVLVSGRAAHDARRIVSVANVWVIGNHGYEVLSPEGEEIANPDMLIHRETVGQAARRLATQVAPVNGVIFEDKGWTLSIHYRLADPAVLPRLRATVEAIAHPLGLHVTEGKMVLEVRPPARVDKGTAVVALALRLGGLSENGACVFLGDDRTDEDAFRALRLRSAEAVTARVTSDSPLPTAAEFSIQDPSEVQEFLTWLANTRAVTRRFG